MSTDVKQPVIDPVHYCRSHKLKLGSGRIIDVIIGYCPHPDDPPPHTVDVPPDPADIADSVMNELRDMFCEYRGPLKYITVKITHALEPFHDYYIGIPIFLDGDDNQKLYLSLGGWNETQ